MGVLLKRPVIPGLIFLYGWELLANLPGRPNRRVKPSVADITISESSARHCS